MKRASFREAISWLASNDDNSWLQDEEPIPSMTAALVCDLFDVQLERLLRDLRRELKKMEG